MKSRLVCDEVSDDRERSRGTLEHTMLPFLVVAALSLAASGQQAAAQRADYYHVVEVYDSESTSIDQLISVLTDKLGATEDKVQPLIGKLEKHGKAVLVAGSEESCNEAAKMFIEIGMKAEVRPLSVTDMPSEYDESDVVVAGAEKLQEVLEDGKGALVAFHAPWCGHCKTMIPALKEAASMLKADGVPVLAIDGQSSPELAAQLGVRAYPALKWLKLVSGSNEDEVALGSADYNGPRDAASLVKFAKAASAATAIKSKLPTGAEGVEAAARPESKLGESKVGGSSVQKAKLPAEAAAAA